MVVWSILASLTWVRILRMQRQSPGLPAMEAMKIDDMQNPKNHEIKDEEIRIKTPFRWAKKRGLRRTRERWAVGKGRETDCKVDTMFHDTIARYG